MNLILSALAAAVVYGLFTLASPTMACRRCSGWGQKTRRRRASACGRCKATGKVFRPGARLIHRGAVLAVRELRERREGER